MEPASVSSAVPEGAIPRSRAVCQTMAAPSWRVTGREAWNMASPVPEATPEERAQQTPGAYQAQGSRSDRLCMGA